MRNSFLLSFVVAAGVALWAALAHGRSLAGAAFVGLAFVGLGTGTVACLRRTLPSGLAAPLLGVLYVLALGGLLWAGGRSLDATLAPALLVGGFFYGTVLVRLARRRGMR